MFIVLLVEFNQGMITISLLPSKTYELSKSSFFLISLAAGAGLVFLLYFTRDVRRFLRGLKFQRDQKKQARIQELYTKGLNSLLAKRNPEATSFFQKVLSINPNHVDTLLRMGITQLRLKNPHEAIRLHQKALSLDSNNPEVLFSLAADYEEAKRYDDALKVYKEILSRDSSNLTALIRMRDLYQRLNQWENLYETQRQLLSNPLSIPEQDVEHRKFVGFKYEFGRSLLEVWRPGAGKKDIPRRDQARQGLYPRISRARRGLSGGPETEGSCGIVGKGIQNDLLEFAPASSRRPLPEAG